MPTKEKTAATLTIYAAPLMTPEGRQWIADWLRHQARNLVKDGHRYSETRFTAKYISDPPAKKAKKRPPRRAA